MQRWLASDDDCVDPQVLAAQVGQWLASLMAMAWAVPWKHCRPTR
ncbi:MAG: hypothetical protein ACOY4A_03915 [Pseudomonadota bacterium]|nr:hypothetical protein [Thermomonas sp. S9]